MGCVRMRHGYPPPYINCLHAKNYTSRTSLVSRENREIGGLPRTSTGHQPAHSSERAARRQARPYMLRPLLAAASAPLLVLAICEDLPSHPFIQQGFQAMPQERLPALKAQT